MNEFFEMSLCIDTETPLGQSLCDCDCQCACECQCQCDTDGSWQ